MRIVQTFWTAGQDPLKHSFGWSHPQYNLMSWALSCLSLREHYDDVELYTDSAGYHILIEVLGLPYTKTHVVFDDFKCLPHHWALAKIKTYSMQTEPFIHVDGDVYLPQPLPADIVDAPLIVQNREIGTSYYKEMMDRILTYPTIRIPDYVAENLGNGRLASYNMGFFGGCDMDFIQRYCHEAFGFMEDNHMNDSTCEHSSVWCNIFFEQVLLAVLADREGIRVADVLGRSIEDEGYTVAEFSDRERYEEKQFFHLLGGHKRCRQNYEMIEKTMSNQDIAFTKFDGEGRATTPTEHVQEGLNYIDSQLKAGYPVVAVVDYKKGTSLGDIWNDLAGDHFVIIVGKTKNGEYRYYDPAKTGADRGTSEENVFRYSNGTFISTSNNNVTANKIPQPYTLTSIRKNL